MVSAEDILIRIRGQDNTAGAFKSVESKAKNLSGSLSTAVGMVGGMIGYDLINAFAESGRQAINASTQIDYFANRLGMSGDEVSTFRNELNKMQQEYRKVNMDAVGATAMDLAKRFDLGKESVADLTKMTTVMSSEFIRNGRTTEDAVLAVADAMDGQFKRLQEIGITRDVLMQKGGWNGNLQDQKSLIDALNKVMGEQVYNYDRIAKDITSLDDAWQALSVAGGNLLASVLIPITPAIISVTEAIVGAINGIKTLPAPLQTAIGGMLAGVMGLTVIVGLAPRIVSAVDTIKDGFGVLRGVVGGLPQIADKFKMFGNETKSVVDTASGAGGLAGKASSAGTGMKSASIGLKSIGQGAMSMLAPLLEISIVIAVMIPVVTALVAEALLFMKAIQLLIDALDFGGVDLNDDLEGIKKLGEVILNIGIVMAEMTFASVMTGIYNVVNGIFMIINPIQIAVTQIKRVIPVVNQLGEANNIDDGIPGKLQKLSESLGSISNAMGSLTGLTLNMAWNNFLTLGGLLGNITSAVTTARTEIQRSANEISKLKDLPDIDQSAVDKLKKVSESIKSVGEAFDALKSIRDNANWDVVFTTIFGGMDIESAITSVRNDIVKAGNALSTLGSLPDIPDENANRLKKIADSIKNVSDAFEALKKIRGDANWDGLMQGIFGGFDIEGAINNVRNDIVKAGNALSTLGSLPDIDDKVGEKLRKVADTLKSVSDMLPTLRKVRDDANWDSAMNGLFGGKDISGAINSIRNDLIKVGNSLQQLINIPDIDGSVANKLNSIAETLRGIGVVLPTLRKFREEANWDSLGQGIFGGMDIVGAINSIRNDLLRVGNSLSTLKNLPDIDGSVAGKIQGISDTLGRVVNAFNTLKSFRDSFNSDTFSQNIFGGVDIPTAISNVRSTLIRSANSLNQLNGIPEIQEGIATKVTRVADATKVVGNAINVMLGANIPEVQILNMLPTKISTAKDVLQRIATQLNQFNVSEIQEGTATKVTRVADATKVVGNALNVMLGANIPNVGVLLMLPMKIAMAKTVVEATARQLNSLQNVQQVPEGLSVKLNGVGSGARAVATAVSGINTIPMVGPEAGMRVGMAVSAIKRAMTELQKLQGGQGVNVAGVVASVRNALNQVRATLGAMQGGFRGSAVGLGSSIVSGVRSGMAGLGGAVSSSVSSGIGSARGTAHSGGQQLGNNATNGFRDSLKLADIARDEMNYAVQAVNSGAGALADATRRAAEQAVQAAKQGAEHQSPGAIARMWGQEIGVYSVDKVLDGSKLLIKTVYDVSRRVVNAWGNPQLNAMMGFTGGANFGLGSLGATNNAYSPLGNSNGKVIVFNFSEGAIPIDARNFTEKEAKQMMILGLENLDMVSNIDIRGV